MTVQMRDYVTIVKAANRKAWDAINELVELQRQWSALDYGTTLVDEEYGLPAADYGAVVFDTANAFVVVLNAGHATNMSKLL